jgi:uncharacterized protein YbjT (DUF2867 family)
MSEPTQHLTLVTGGTGTTGRRVAERLADREIPVRIGSRSGAPRFDWDDPASWDALLDGVRAAYVCFAPDVAIAGAAATVGAFAERAASHGVERLVFLSGRGEEGAQAAERAVIAAGLPTTVVRCSWFMQNFSEGFMREPLDGGEPALPVAGVREPFVDADDIADVAVAALTQPGHAGRVYELTGPRAISFAEAVAEIARASGRDLRLLEIGIDDFAAALAAEGLPPDQVALLRYLFSEVLDGRNTPTADGVREALGRDPRDFASFARAAQPITTGGSGRS